MTLNAFDHRAGKALGWRALSLNWGLLTSQFGLCLAHSDFLFCVDLFMECVRVFVFSTAMWKKGEFPTFEHAYPKTFLLNYQLSHRSKISIATCPTKTNNTFFFFHKWFPRSSHLLEDEKKEKDVAWASILSLCTRASTNLKKKMSIRNDKYAHPGSLYQEIWFEWEHEWLSKTKEMVIISVGPEKKNESGNIDWLSSRIRR